ncbi:MAG: adenylate/guanylate cyclase domain-containing protein [Chitinophagales bacterium]
MPGIRQLAAILFADIQGYTALMHDDEKHANILRDKLKQSLEEQVAAHYGRILKFSGDGALCIFTSSIEAVHAAIEIQKKMQLDPQVPLRIGIHTGDVMFEEADVHGDGVNVASRIESFGVARAVFISGRVHEDIKNQKDIQTISLGKFELKNVAVPVELFAISNAGLVVPKRELLEGKGKQFVSPAQDRKKNLRIILSSLLVIAIAIFLLGKYFFVGNANADINSIAVLPFEKIDKGDTSEFLSSGLAEEIRTRLSKVAVLKVIARASSAGYANSQKAPSVIGGELGVGALLTGSVQRQDSQIVVRVQLVNCKNNQQLWSEKYLRSNRNLFELQSEVAQKVVQQLGAKLSASDKNNLQEVPTTNALAYDYYMEAQNIINSFEVPSHDAYQKATQLLDKAIQLDPNFVDAYQRQIDLDLLIYRGTINIGQNASLNRIDSLVQHLNEIAPDDPRTAEVHATYKRVVFKDFDGAKEFLLPYIATFPNDAKANFYLGICYKRLFQLDSAIIAYKRAIVLDPKSCINWRELQVIYKFQRDSANARKTYEHSLQVCREDNEKITAEAKIKYPLILEGNLAKAEAALRAFSFKKNKSSRDSWFQWLYLIEGKIDSAAMLDRPETKKDTIYENDYNCYSELRAYYARLKDDSADAKKYSRIAINFLNVVKKKQPGNFLVFSSLAECYAILKMEAPCRENLQIFESLFPARDEKFGEIGITEEELKINMLMYKEDETLELMKKLLELPLRQEGSVFLYRLKPDYRFLHNNPGYKKLVGE